MLRTAEATISSASALIQLLLCSFSGIWLLDTEMWVRGTLSQLPTNPPEQSAGARVELSE